MRLEIISEKTRLLKDLPYNTIVLWIDEICMISWSDNKKCNDKELVSLENSSNTYSFGSDSYAAVLGSLKVVRGKD